MKLFLVLISGLFMVIACGNKQAQPLSSEQASVVEMPGDSGKVYRLLRANEFKAQMQKENGVLLDVRTPGEYKKGFIAGATLMDIFSDDFDAKLALLDKSKTYYVYCAKGGRSEECSEKMMALGFKRVFDLDGGISGWKDSGLPIEMPK
ncbi:MAG: rhodanese-like domain-containing protein [Bacteroidetes bacterium]|nr:MAG: rhodanese-like domain-containing protein [Bacteroidota bacterium]